MKFQIFLLLAVFACAFADEANEELKVDVSDDVNEIEAEIDAINDEDGKIKENKQNSGEAKKLKDDKMISSDEKEEDESQEDKKPIIFEWTSLYGTHDIDVVAPIELDWPENWVDFINAMHSDGFPIDHVPNYILDMELFSP